MGRANGFIPTAAAMGTGMSDHGNQIATNKKIQSVTPIVDSFGRVHTSLRVSVTDRCNIRCFYCMPDENIRFLPRDEVLRFEDIQRFVRVTADMGVRQVRITGGEPLVRTDLPKLIELLNRIDGIDDIAMTTNGMLLASHASSLRDAGLQRINISLDALSAETFRRIARRDGLNRVLEGIEAAQNAGFEKLRLNAVVIRGVNEDEVIPLAAFARRNQLELRFIEFMPLDAEGNWASEQVLSGEDIRRELEAAFGELIPTARGDLSQPAVDFEFADGQGRIGFVNSVTQPFCRNCNRLRLTAEGQVRNCLFSTTEWDARDILRGGGTDEELAQLIRDCVRAKKAGHGIDSDHFIKPARAMYQIGG